MVVGSEALWLTWQWVGGDLTMVDLFPSYFSSYWGILNRSGRLCNQTWVSIFVLLLFTYFDKSGHVKLYSNYMCNLRDIWWPGKSMPKPFACGENTIKDWNRCRPVVKQFWQQQRKLLKGRPNSFQNSFKVKCIRNSLSSSFQNFMTKIGDIGDEEVGDEDDGDLPGLLRDIVVWLF